MVRYNILEESYIVAAEILDHAQAKNPESLM